MRTFDESECETIATDIARDGVAVVPDAVDAAMLTEIRDELERLQRVRPGGELHAKRLAKRGKIG